MGKTLKSPSAPEPSDIAKLAEVVQGLTHQVQQLALVLDEVREDVVWAVRNDKFHCAGHSQQYVANYTARPPETEEDDEEAIPPPEPLKPYDKPMTTLFE